MKARFKTKQLKGKIKMEYVERWKNQFIKEGESPVIATIHAIQRAFEGGYIEEDTADMLEKIAKKEFLKPLKGSF